MFYNITDHSLIYSNASIFFCESLLASHSNYALELFFALLLIKLFNIRIVIKCHIPDALGYIWSSKYQSFELIFTIETFFREVLWINDSIVLKISSVNKTNQFKLKIKARLKNYLFLSENQPIFCDFRISPSKFWNMT